MKEKSIETNAVPPKQTRVIDLEALEVFVQGHNAATAQFAAAIEMLAKAGGVLAVAKERLSTDAQALLKAFREPPQEGNA